jgi:hypothetical protein
MSSFAQKQALLAGDFGSLPEIETRASRVVKAIFLDRHHFVRGGVYLPTLSPYTLRDMAAYDVRELFTVNAACPHRAKLLVMNYEEADMATGDYLLSLVHKYAVTGRAQVHEEARRVFGAIMRLCHNAFTQNPYGRGWLPKPYLGIEKVGEIFECSVDQYTKIALALDWYARELASPADRAQAEDTLVAFAEWWAGHWYTANYFGNCCWWWKTNMPHPEAWFLYILALVERLTGDRLYAREFRKLLQFQDALFNVQRVETNACNLTAECLERLVELKPGYRRLWLRALQGCWEFSRDHTTGEGYCPQRLGESGRILVNNGGRVAGTAAVASQFLREGKRLREWGRQVLSRYNHREMFHHLHPDSDHLPKAFAFEADTLSGHHFTSWLHAYWKLERLSHGRLSLGGS